MTDTAVNKKIDWKLIDISDREIFENTGENEDGIAMFGFASLFFWKEYYKTSYAVINGNIVCRGVSDKGNCVVYFPRGLNENVKSTVDAISADCCGSLKLHPLTEKTAKAICTHYPDAKLTLVEGKCEYVYNRDDLANLAGKKYHAKRNHIAKFDKSYEAEYININNENIGILEECAEYMYRLIENSPEDEYLAIKCAIRHFDALGLRGAVIKVNVNYVAYSIGSSINDDTADIHFEKADRAYDGAYAKINNSFAKYGWEDKKYLNREEDLGMEGLRKAKLSYYPCKLNCMYTVELF